MNACDAFVFEEHTRPRVFRPAPSPVGVKLEKALDGECRERSPVFREGACAPNFMCSL